MRTIQQIRDENDHPEHHSQTLQVVERDELRHLLAIVEAAEYMANDGGKDVRRRTEEARDAGLFGEVGE